MNGKFGALAFSIVVHLVAFGLVALSFSQQPQTLGNAPVRVETVEAVVVDDARVERELRRLKGAELSQREAEDARKRKLQQELDQARKAKQAEDRHLAELKQKREQETRAAELQRKQLAELKEQQAELEKKRQTEQQRLAETQKKREAEELKAKQAEAQRQMQQQLAAEEKRMKALAKRQESGRLRNQYVLDISNKVRNHWLRPAGSADEFECEVMVRQSEGGEVQSAQVTKSCGNAVLDRSVEAAVRKASPLPEPADPSLFDNEIRFQFKPRQ